LADVISDLVVKMKAKVILACSLGEISEREILLAMSGEMIHHSFTL
jgi:hypothetical protein